MHHPFSRKVLCAALSAFVLALASPQAKAEEKTPAIESFTLKNGMEVIVIPNHRVPAVSHMLWFRIGAADDPPGESGLAHYHEHMMFRGTPKHKAGEYAELITRNGGTENAFTSYDATVYYVSIAKDRLPLVMELEADRLQHLDDTEKDALREREVILEERRARIENIPDALLNEQMGASLFLHYPYHNPVIGWMKEMEQLTLQEVMQLHHDYYKPANAILIVSGDITRAELEPLAQKYYGAIPPGKVLRRVRNEEPPQIVERRLVMHHVNVKQAGWLRDYFAPSFAYGDKDKVMPLYLLAQVLGGGKTSRLHTSIVVGPRLANDIGADYNGMELGPGTFSVAATPAHQSDLPALEQAIDEQIRLIAEKGVTEDELTRAKTLLKAESIYARDGLESVAHVMGWMRIVGLPIDTFQRWPDMVGAVTAAQVQQAAKEVLVPEHSVTGILLPPEAPSAAEKKPQPQSGGADAPKS